MEYRTWSLMAVLALALAAPAMAGTVVSLDGTWRFALDPAKEGAAKAWFDTTLPDTIRLPGTTDENRKGARSTATNFTNHLSREFPYSGPAWYQRDVNIPAGWKGQHIALLLERTKHTAVWVDGAACGEWDTLAAMQTYDLGAVLTPGRHTLTICVDNAKRPGCNGGHQLSDDTQTNWNGLLGRLELRARDPVWIEDVQVYPDAAAHRARVRITLGNRSGAEASGQVDLAATCWNGAGFRAAPGRASFARAADGTTIEAVYELGADAPTWDEFAPVLCRLSLRLSASAEGRAFADEREVDFGLRDFTAKGTQFAVNGRTVFLRGKHDACVFPLTGYAPMTEDGWRRVFRIAKSYGLNHYRFHSWCPPEAAFAAADREGLYLQPELPNFGGDLGKNAAAAEYTRAEGLRILAAFGNHPSFAMLALGNEMWGGRVKRAEVVRDFRAADPRHLYAQASNYEFGEPKLAEGDDYWTTMRTKVGLEGNVRGSFSHADLPLGHVQTGPPGAAHDYAQAIAGVPVPVLGHEVGQYQTSPNFRELARYTGVLRPWNLETFRRRMEAKGLLAQADEFVRASGALSVLCYREEIEAALRTPGFGGFQLLDLQDFPGQGTALVGILDAFMDSKGLIEPAAWRGFCSETVPLLRFAKYAWTTDESFDAAFQLAHYGPRDFPGVKSLWKARTQDGRIVAQGGAAHERLAAGGVRELGRVRFALAAVPAPAKVTIEAGISGGCENRYDIWVYPAKVDVTAPAGVTVARAWDARTRELLAQGGRVLLLPEPGQLTAANSIEGFFAGDFWCYPMFRGICEGKKAPPAPGTLGLLCDPKHPALAGFPTEFHSNWQWWPVVMNSRALILDAAPADFRPIVQVIDNFERNHKLGLVFEARVGAGRLLVCASQLPALSDRPEARQLLASLLAYAGSPKFQPASALTPELLEQILAPAAAGAPRE